MSTFTASDLGVADLLALAGPDEDGAPCSGGPPRPQLARPVPGMTAIAQEPIDAAAGSPGLHPPVTASRAEMIAAAPGRARQQRAPALTGVG